MLPCMPNVTLRPTVTRSRLTLQMIIAFVLACLVVALVPTIADARGVSRVSGVHVAARSGSTFTVSWRAVPATSYTVAWAESRRGLRHPHKARVGRNAARLPVTRTTYAWIKVRAYRGGAKSRWSAPARVVAKATSSARTIGRSFSEDFDGGSLNTNQWTREQGSGYGIESFRADNDLVTLDGAGHAVVSAKKNADGSWRGGMISTRNIFSMRAGTVEIRAKLPTTQGAWPAMWMINNLYGQLHSEIDIMELFPGGGSQGQGAYFTVHNWTANPQVGANLRPSTSAADGGWHTWRFVWTPSSMELFIDGASQGRFTPANLKPWVWSGAPLYLVFNMAVGGSWSGATRPAAGTSRMDMLIDYIKVDKTL
jgi:beta-glucanase (GH16 family)